MIRAPAWRPRELLKRDGIADGEVGEDLAVDLDAGLAKPVHEAAVGQLVQACAALMRVIQSRRKSPSCGAGPGTLFLGRSTDSFAAFHSLDRPPK